MSKWNKPTGVIVNNDKFDELAYLWIRYQNDGSSNFRQLKFRIDNIYSVYNREEKKSFTKFMVFRDLLDESVVCVLNVFRGTLEKLT